MNIITALHYIIVITYKSTILKTLFQLSMWFMMTWVKELLHQRSNSKHLHVTPRHSTAHHSPTLHRNNCITGQVRTAEYLATHVHTCTFNTRSHWGLFLELKLKHDSCMCGVPWWPMYPTGYTWNICYINYVFWSNIASINYICSKGSYKQYIFFIKDLKNILTDF